MTSKTIKVAVETAKDRAVVTRSATSSAWEERMEVWAVSKQSSWEEGPGHHSLRAPDVAEAVAGLPALLH